MASSPTPFVKARASQEVCCVEVRRSDPVIIRDSKYTGVPAARPLLRVPGSEWATFLDEMAARQPRFDGDHLILEGRPDDLWSFASSDGTVELLFTAEEFAAFLDGVDNHEFDVVVELV